jgi:hypothetical protein
VHCLLETGEQKVGRATRREGEGREADVEEIVVRIVCN